MTQQRTDYPLDYGKGPSSSTGDLSHHNTSESADRIKDVGANAREMADNIANQARAYGGRAQDALREFKPMVEKSMRDQPMTTLMGATVLGFLLGALWKK